MQTTCLRANRWPARTDHRPLKSSPGLPQAYRHRWAALMLLVLATLFAAAPARAERIDVAAGVVVIANDGQCSLREAIINANNAAQTHADCPAGDVDEDNFLVLSGGVYTLTDRAVSDAFGNTGLPYITRDLWINGGGGAIRSGNTCNVNGTQTPSEFRLFRVVGATLTVDELTLSQGCADGTGNARLGGAIYVDQSRFFAWKVTLSGNRAYGGGAIYSDGNAGIGILDSTLAGNTATLGAALNVDGRVEVIASTISGNSTFSLGAGAYLRPGASLYFDFVSDDGSASAQPNEIYASNATVRIKNSFFRNARCAADAGAPASTWIASGNNLDTGVHCASLFGSNIEASATINLGPLANNGGPTQTRALLTGSSAINAARDCTLQEGLIFIKSPGDWLYDQRFVARPQGAFCDIGAFELVLPMVPGQTIFVDAVDGVGVVPILSDGLCSLREAIDNANAAVPLRADCEAGGDGEDTIVLPAGAVFTVGDAFVSNSQGNTGLPYVKSELAIKGNGATIQRSTATACNINGANDPGELRLLFVEMLHKLTIEDLTLAHGCADAGEEGGSGGAILNYGNLTIRRSTIRDNQAGNRGGAIVAFLDTTLIESSTLSGNAAPSGGALFTGGDITLRNSTLSGNSATVDGGGATVFSGKLHLEQSTLFGNSAPSGGGVAISFFVFAGGQVLAKNTVFQNSTCGSPLAFPLPGSFIATGNNLENGDSCLAVFFSNFTSNVAPNLGPLANNGSPMRTHAPLGGSPALNAASDCTAISGNPIATDQRGLARPQAGVCDIGAIEVHTAPPAATVINADAVSGVGVVAVRTDGLCSLREAFENANSTSASFLHPECEPGHVAGLDQIVLPPGAVYTLTDAAVTAPLGRTGLPPVSSLIAVQGNGATIQSGNACTFNSTQAAGEFRLLLVQSGTLGTQNLTLANGCADGGTGARDGGAIYVAAGAGANLLNTTLRSNRARSGGAVYSEGSVLLQGSTLSANTATFGGAIYTNGTATLSNATVSGNSATSLGGAGYLLTGGTFNIEQSTLFNNTSAQLAGIYANAATVNLKNSILANTRCVENTDVTPSTWSGSGNSLDDGMTCATRFGANVASNSVLLMAPLADHGGATETHALLPGSPAIEAATVCTRINGSSITVDQRGIARPQNLVCDIGAFESRGFAVTAVSGGGQSTVVNAPFANPLVVAVSSNFGEPVNGGRVSFSAALSGPSLNPPTSTISIAGGQASLAATANAVAGNHVVTATTRGSLLSLPFNLSNLPVSANIFANGFE